MTQQGVSSAATGRGALTSLPHHKLDELTHEELRRTTLSEVEHCGEFSDALAGRLDGVFMVKIVRLMRSTQARVADFQSVDDLIAGVGRDKFAQQLDGHTKKYFARWKTLRDLLSVARRMEDFALAVREESIGGPDASWEAVADAVVSAGKDGVSWSELARVLMSGSHGPKSKSGVSQLLTAMRAEGWVESITRGRTKRFSSGPKIAASRAWRKANDASRTTEREEQVAVVAEANRTGVGLPKFADLARRVVCLNQGAYIEFSYLAHERHRELRELCERLRQITPSGSLSNSTELLERTKSLLSFVDLRFKSVALQNFELIREHYYGRSEVMPRVCIKGNWERHPRRQKTVAPIIRDDGSTANDLTYLTDDNTGFKEVIDEGRYYNNPDIARAALLRRYRNPRLNELALAKLRGRLDLSSIESGRGLKADEWLKCWVDWKKDADPRRFYRSTLIVPMTLRNNNLSQEFRDQLSVRVPQFKITEYDRSILGFVCLDHPQAGFFNSDEDVALGYIVADQLSLYTFTRVVLTTLSSLFQQAMKDLSQGGLAALPPDFLTWMDELIKQAAPREGPHASPALELQTTRVNQLVNLASYSELEARSADPVPATSTS